MYNCTPNVPFSFQLNFKKINDNKSESLHSSIQFNMPGEKKTTPEDCNKLPKMLFKASLLEIRFAVCQYKQDY